MEAFLKFFFEFITSILLGFSKIFVGIFEGITSIFNIGKYISIFSAHSKDFDILSWILAVFSIILVLAVFVLIGYLLFLLTRKYKRYRRAVIENEDLLTEIGKLNREVVKLSREKDKILAMKVAQLGITPNAILDNIKSIENEFSESSENAVHDGAKKPIESNLESRFFKLTDVDKKYLTYEPHVYDNEISLEDICNRFRNFACYRMGLYYDIKIIRLLLSGMASTKLIVLQGISGTGKTSLPYSFGKFLANDSTIASVQPSWRDRSEIFGFFNEFTKKFNETEVLRRIYESSYNDDINVVILDEMNIARIEYYFAEMLSVLEMPNQDEWVVDLVPSVWESDPVKLTDGKLRIPPNLWYVGTANNDDSTFAVSDKVYDRALPINLDSKGIAFDAPETDVLCLSYSHLNEMFKDAIQKNKVSAENLDKISKLDIYVIEKLRIAFGNRIIKQLRDFVPVYVACGGTEIDGIDYILAHKIFRKFESLNLSFIRDELKGLIDYINKSFGKENMSESKAYLERLRKMF